MSTCLLRSRLGLTALLLAPLFACSKPESAPETPPLQPSSETPAAAAPAVPVKKLAFVTNGTSDFWVFAKHGIARADEELEGIETDFQLVSDGTPAEQRRVIDDLVTNGIDGLAFSPLDPVNQAPYVDDLAKKISIVTCDSDIPNSSRIAYVGTDNIAAGRQAGELIKEAIPEGGPIMLFVGRRDQQNAKERIQGIEEALKGSNVTILDVRTDEQDQARAKGNVSDALVTNPDLKCCVGLWSYNTPAILNAVREAGKIGEVKIVGFDEDDQTLAGVRDGEITGTVVQQPYEFGYRSMHLLAKIVNGDRSQVPSNGLMIVETLIIRQPDAQAYLEKMHAMLGK